MRSARKVGDDLRERRARPVFRCLGGMPDVDEAGDLLMGGEPERIEHAAIIGIPFGDPGRAEAERMGGDQEAHGGRARRQHLLPFRDFDVGRGAAHHRDHQRRAGEARALVRDVFRLGIGIFGDERRGDRLAGLLPSLALEHDETPWGELAVVGYPGSDGQQGRKFGRRGPRRPEFVRLDRAAMPQKINGIGHELAPGPLASTLPGPRQRPPKFALGGEQSPRKA